MIKVLELFAGIGSQVQALKNADIPYECVGISEIDKYAIQAYELIHGATTNFGDITKIDTSVLPDFDLLTYSFPCQDISVAGHQLGLDEDAKTRSSLLWECKRIIEAKKPKYLLLENVKNLVGPTHRKNFDKWLEYLTTLGYKNFWKVLNAVDYDCPQSRERVFVVSILDKDATFTFPESHQRILKIKDILEDESVIPSNMYMAKPYIPKEKVEESSNGLIHVGNLDMAANESIKRVYSPDGVCPTLTTMGGGHRQPKIFINNKVRKLTPRECWKVMGFTDNEYNCVDGKLSNTQLYKQAGNTICVPCMEAIFKKLFTKEN